MAATTGLAKRSSRSKPAWASRESSAASAASLHVAQHLDLGAGDEAVLLAAGDARWPSPPGPSRARRGPRRTRRRSPGRGCSPARRGRRRGRWPRRPGSRRGSSSMSLVVMSGLRTVEDDRGAEPAGGADGEQRVAPLAARQLPQRLGDHAGAGGAEGVAERDRPAVGVEPGRDRSRRAARRGPASPRRTSGRRRPGGWRAPGPRRPRASPRCPCRRGRGRPGRARRARRRPAPAGAGRPGRWRRRRRRAGSPSGFTPSSLGPPLRHEDHRGGAVGERGGVAGGDGAVAPVEDRLQRRRAPS